MPSAICQTCGRMTNSATSNYWNHKPLEGKDFQTVTKCFVAVGKDNNWEKGCGWKDAWKISFAS